jgi:hypothetical protein
LEAQCPFEDLFLGQRLHQKGSGYPLSQQYHHLLAEERAPHHPHKERFGATDFSLRGAAGVLLLQLGQSNIPKHP